MSFEAELASTSEPPGNPFEHDLDSERRWSDVGAKIAACSRNEKLIEEKESRLRSVIAENYSRIRDVESELKELQLQLKMTSGPKKSVLELLRQKIESQNDRISDCRAKYQDSKKAMEAAAAELEKEEGVKAQLCEELNLVVQQSANAQFEKLEQLTARLEQLSSGIPDHSPMSNAVSKLADTVAADAAAASAQVMALNGEAPAEAPEKDGAGGPGGPAAAPSAPAAAKKPQGRAGRKPAGQAGGSRAASERREPSAQRPAQQLPRARAGDGFAGFDT
mmetsp:Transcript_17844/g.42819  ORF Transcript_17844/g.42819 Transcript_17844/m.42819 type:complete len:278 (+) Transcript_17844:151-984(+)